MLQAVLVPSLAHNLLDEAGGDWHGAVGSVFILPERRGTNVNSLRFLAENEAVCMYVCVCLFLMADEAGARLTQIAHRTNICRDLQAYQAICSQRPAAAPAKQAPHQLISLIVILSCSALDGVISDCLKSNPTSSPGQKGTCLLNYCCIYC